MRPYSLKSLLRIIPNLPKYVRLYWRLIRDSRVSRWLKLMLLLALAYVVSPIDLIPDYSFPVLGQLDDMAVMVLVLRFFLTASPPQAVEEHMRATGLTSI